MAEVPEIRVFPDIKAIATEAAERVVRAQSQALALKEHFNIALSGGSTPKALFELLMTDPWFDRIEWSKWQVFWADERCVPPSSDQSNYRMAHELFLKEAPIPSNQVHRMRGEADPVVAAVEYEQTLETALGAEGVMDLTLLGMGADAHTASLFPNTTALDERDRRCVANYIEKLKSWRLTLTAPFINQSAEVVFMVAGKDKAEAMQGVLEGPRDPHRLPGQLIKPIGKLVWLADAYAAGMAE